MAIKDQCIGCSKYSKDNDICSFNQQTPIYNSSSCPNYSTTRINLNKTDENSIGEDNLSGNLTTSQPTTEVVNPTSNVQTSTGWKRYFSFNGRIGRGEYALTYLFYIIYCIFMEIWGEIDVDNLEGFLLLMWLLISFACILFIIPAIWIVFAQGAKRCHDRGNSGWFQIIPYYFLWMLFAKGEEQPNEYGDPV